MVISIARGATAEPMMEINTTPLIDVMLVLLIMLIITVPAATHAVKIDVPTSPTLAHNPVVNRVEVTSAGQYRWNGRPASDASIGSTLDAVAADPARPELQVQPAGDARYERVDRLMAMIKRAGVTRMGFVGNEQFRRF